MSPQAKPMTEADIETRFVKWCEAEGYPCLKLTLQGQRGYPDRTVILPNGRMLFVEFKKPGGKLSPQQKQWGEKLIRMGHTWIVTTDASFAMTVVEGMLS